MARIIRYLKDRGLIYDSKKKVSFYARTGKLAIRRQQKKKLRIKEYKAKQSGDLVQMDLLLYFGRDKNVITGDRF